MQIRSPINEAAVVPGQEHFPTAARQQRLQRLEYLLVESIEVALQFTLAFVPWQVRIPVAHATKVQRIATEKQAVYMVLPNEAQDGAKCLAVVLRMVDVVQRTPQLRSGHIVTNFRQAGCGGMIVRVKIDLPAKAAWALKISVTPNARGVGCNTQPLNRLRGALGVQEI